MKKLLFFIALCYTYTVHAQDLEILIKEAPPYKLYQDITIEIYLTNTTTSPITYFDSRGPSWGSFKEVWDMRANNRFIEILPLNGAYSGKFPDSTIIMIPPGDTNLIRTKVLNLKITGLYSFTYMQEQSPEFVKKEYACNSIIQKITAFKVSKNIKFEVFNNYDTTITELIKMTWKEWKEYSHVKVYSQKKHFDNINTALRHPQDVYSLTLYCDDLKGEDIKRISRLKNLKALTMRNYELDFFPQELAELNLYELTIIPKNKTAVSFAEGLSKNNTLRKLTAKFYAGIPKQVLTLKYLMYLDISNCPIKTFPNFETLQNLEVLIANNAKISTINKAGFSKLLKLKDLDLSGNKAIDDLFPILNCTNLEFLVINRTSIQTIPDEIENLYKLKKLSISSSITAVSDSIGNLNDMRYLSLGGNRELTYVPNSIKKMQKLLHLDLSNTKIEQLPEGIVDLPLKKVLIYNTNCKITKEYKWLKNHLKNNFID